MYGILVAYDLVKWNSPKEILMGIDLCSNFNPAEKNDKTHRISQK